MKALPTIEECKKAERVKADVKAHTPFTWDETGQLVHQSQVVEGSSLPDLISHHLDLAMKKKTWSAKESTCWEMFASTDQI